MPKIINSLFKQVLQSLNSSTKVRPPFFEQGVLKMKKVLNLVVGLAIAMGAVAAHAGGDVTSHAADKGFFVEGGIGTNTVARYNDGEFAVATHALALIANAGYSFNQYIAAEAGYSLHHDGDYVPGNAHDLHAAARATLPLGDKVKLFGKLGLGVAMQEGADSRVGPFFGAGASYAVTDAADVTVQYQGLHLSGENGLPGFTQGSVTAGVTYHIG